MVKENLVTPDMVRKAIDEYSYLDHSYQVFFEGVAKHLNEQIHSRCLYCDHGDNKCQCWNDE